MPQIASLCKFKFPLAMHLFFVIFQIQYPIQPHQGQTKHYILSIITYPTTFAKFTVPDLWIHLDFISVLSFL